MDYRAGDPAPLVEYSNEEHAVWRTVWNHLGPLHARLSVREWRNGAERLALDTRWIPQLVEVNEAFGAGLLSSFGELGEFASRASLRTFDIEQIAATSYDPTDYQKVLFVAPSFSEMVRLLRAWLEQIIRMGSIPAVR